MKKNKICVISAVVSAIMLASSASTFAKFDAYNDPDVLRSVIMRRK